LREDTEIINDRHVFIGNLISYPFSSFTYSHSMAAVVVVAVAVVVTYKSYRISS